MGNVRTKVDALKDLGEKITGKTFGNEDTVVEMIDEITKNYDGGSTPSPTPTPTQKNFIRIKSEPPARTIKYNNH